MPNPARRDDYDSAALSRQARKQIDRLQEQVQLNQAAAETRYRQQLDRVRADDQLALCEEALKIVGSHQLAKLAIVETVGLDALITQVTPGKPGLELTARGFGETAATTSNMAMYRYGVTR